MESEILSNEHKNCYTLRNMEQGYRNHPTAWKDNTIPKKMDPNLAKTTQYQNWGARACAHRGHCVGAAERGVLCRNPQYYPDSRYQMTDVGREWHPTYTAMDSYLSAKPIDVTTIPTNYHVPPRTRQNHVHDYYGTHSLVYHSSVEAELPKELINTQFSALKTIQDLKPAPKEDYKRIVETPTTSPKPEPTESTQCETPSTLQTPLASPSQSPNATRKKKPKNVVKKAAPPKWKKAYYDTVRNYKSEKVGLILVGPDGPEFYAKVPKNSKVPMKNSLLLELNQKPEEQDDCELKALPSSNNVGEGDGQASKTANQKLDAENKFKETQEAPRQEQKVIEEANEKNKEETEETKAAKQLEKLNEKQSKSRIGTPQRSEAVDTSVTTSMALNESMSQRSVSDTKSSESGIKTIYRAKGSEKHSDTTESSARTYSCDNKMDKVSTWLKEGNGSCGAISISPMFRKKEEKLMKLKECLPSGRNKEEHLSQLKHFIKQYVRFLEEKAQIENVIIHDGSRGVKIEAGKIIDAVEHPLKRLDSDITVNMTQTVTDALVATDEAAADPSFFRFLKKIRSDKFQKVLTNVNDLQELVHIMDALAVHNISTE